MFLLGWQRNEAKKANHLKMEVIPADVDAIGAVDVVSDPNAAAVVETLEMRLIEGAEIDNDESTQLRLVLMPTGCQPEPKLLRCRSLASNEAQLTRVSDTTADGSPSPG